MAEAARKLEPDAADNWLPISTVAKRTGLSERQWRKRCQALESRGLAERRPALGKGPPGWWIHCSVDPRLSRCPDRPTRDRRVDLSGYPEHHVEQALRKTRWVRRYVELTRSGPEAAACEQTRIEALDQGDFGFSPSSLRGWARVWRQRGVSALLPRYGQPAEADAQSRSPEALRFFHDLYLTQQRVPLTVCHRLTVQRSARAKWSWPASLSATRKWLAATADLATVYLHRWGPDAWRHKYMPYQEQDYAALVPGQMYVCDHHQLKCFARYKGQTVRPWLTGIEDACTRVIVGWHLGPTPHTDAILSAIRVAFDRWGVPATVKIDNGKDFDSKVVTGTTKSELRALRRSLGRGWKDAVRRERAKVGLNPSGWWGILPELGCEIIRAIPYEPQSKLIERFFRTFTDQLVRTWPTFCGTSPADKPEALKLVLSDRAAVPELEDLAAQVGTWLDSEYHRQPHRGDGMNGLSPQARWNSSPTRPAVAESGALALLCQVRGRYRVGPNGVRIKIGSSTIGYGQYDPKLQRLKGRDVLVAVDPADVSRAFVFTPTRDKRRLITVAQANERVSPNAKADDMREAQGRINRARKDARRAVASAPDRMKTAARLAREEAAARQAERLRATGTDDSQPAGGDGAPIRVARTGFEAAAQQVEKAAKPRPSRRDAADVARRQAARSVLSYRRAGPQTGRKRVSADVLEWSGKSGSPEDDGERTDDGTDAGAKRQDAFEVLARESGHDNRAG